LAEELEKVKAQSSDAESSGAGAALIVAAELHEHKTKNEENEKLIEEMKKEIEANSVLKLASESGASEQMEQVKLMHENVA